MELNNLSAPIRMLTGPDQKNDDQQQQSDQQQPWIYDGPQKDPK